jgi:hypothetical protein
MILSGAQVLQALGAGAALSFAAPLEDAVPREGPGIYTVWDDTGRFLYVGIAGAGGGKGGLLVRLASHAAGRRFNDPFCVLVADRLVLPLLTEPERAAIADGRQSFDALIRAHIRRHLSCRWALTGTPEAARGWEASLRRGAWDHGAPLLNPASPVRTSREERDPGML